MASALLSKLTMATAGAAVLTMGVVSSAPAEAAVLNFSFKTISSGFGSFLFDDVSKGISSFVYNAPPGGFNLPSASGGTGIGGFTGSKFSFSIFDTTAQNGLTVNWSGFFKTLQVPGGFTGGLGFVDTKTFDAQGDIVAFGGEKTVPEPTTIVCSILGLGALAGARLKRKSAQ